MSEITTTQNLEEDGPMKGLETSETEAMNTLDKVRREISDARQNLGPGCNYQARETALKKLETDIQTLLNCGRVKSITFLLEQEYALAQAQTELAYLTSAPKASNGQILSYCSEICDICWNVLYE